MTSFIFTGVISDLYLEEINLTGQAGESYSDMLYTSLRERSALLLDTPFIIIIIIKKYTFRLCRKPHLINQQTNTIAIFRVAMFA